MALPDLARYRSDFPVTERYAYLNHAAVAPLPKRVVQTMTGWLNERALSGGVHFGQWVQRVQQVRGKAARLIGARPEEIALVKNTSEGVLLAAESIPWRAGDNVVTVQGEFPANVYPWMQLAERGVETRFASMAQGRVSVDAIAERMDRHTRAVAVSWVQFASGFRCDLAALSQLCADRDAYLFVDAAQGIGALALDVGQYRISFLSANSGKWMLGPGGIGLFYCAAGVLDGLRTTHVSWRSVQNAEDLFRYDMTLLPSAARFEEGSWNMGGVYGLDAALDLLLEAGTDAVEARVAELVEAAVEAVDRLGLRLFSPRHPRERSGIVAFQHPERDAREVVARLKEGGVIVSQIGPYVRVSPHFYNTEEEIQRWSDLL